MAIARSAHRTTLIGVGRHHQPCGGSRRNAISLGSIVSACSDRRQLKYGAAHAIRAAERCTREWAAVSAAGTDAGLRVGVRGNLLIHGRSDPSNARVFLALALIEWHLRTLRELRTSGSSRPVTIGRLPRSPHGPLQVRRRSTQRAQGPAYPDRARRAAMVSPGAEPVAHVPSQCRRAERL